MKLISWNCQGAFRKKAEYILNLNPDILIVQECEHPDKLKFETTIKKPNDFYWYGMNKNKGLGIYSYSDYSIELLPIFNPEFRYIIPFRITGNGQSFNLLAIWAMDNKENPKARYIGQIWLAINYYESLFGNPTILIGDFNSNKIWDKKDRVGNHSEVVNKLENLNIHSVYHTFFKHEQGKEKHPTFFLHRNQNKPYHLDYCFASKDFIDKVNSVEIGDYKEWISLSDHLPVSVNFS